MNGAQEPCELLAWDSGFFGVTIARARGSRLTGERLAAIERWCGDRRVACLYFLADAEHPPTVALAEDSGFRLVDVRMSFARALEGPPPPPRDWPGILIRPQRTSDLEPLQALARSNHRDTRFFSDEHFARARAAELYAAWIARSCTDAEGEVLVAEVDGVTSGYVACQVTPTGEGSIGLIGVEVQARRRGVGAALLASALAWFHSQGCTAVSVVTQGRNIDAQRLYQGAGFVTSSLQLWFHRWFQQGT